MWYNSIASASTGLVPNALALFNSRRVAPTVYPGGREQAGRGFAVSIATWRVYRRPGQPGGSFTGRRNAPAFTSASTPALSGKTVERWVDPLGLHFTKTLVPTSWGSSSQSQDRRRGVRGGELRAQQLHTLSSEPLNEPAVPQQASSSSMNSPVVRWR